MKEKIFTREEIENTIAEFKTNGLNKTKLTRDFMDNFVAKLHTEDMDQWVEKCLSFPATTRKIGGVEKTVPDDKSVRKYFIEKYLPEFTDEAVAVAKAKKKAEREARKAEREAEKNKTPEEKFRDKMARLSKEA